MSDVKYTVGAPETAVFSEEASPDTLSAVTSAGTLASVSLASAVLSSAASAACGALFSAA